MQNFALRSCDRHVRQLGTVGWFRGQFVFAETNKSIDYFFLKYNKYHVLTSYT